MEEQRGVGERSGGVQGAGRGEGREEMARKEEREGAEAGQQTPATPETRAQEGEEAWVHLARGEHGEVKGQEGRGASDRGHELPRGGHTSLVCLTNAEPTYAY